MESPNSGASAVRGALLVVYLTAIVLVGYALFGQVDGDGQLSLVAVAMCLFGIGAVLPGNALKK